jgi:hypothetical protein
VEDNYRKRLRSFLLGLLIYALLVTACVLAVLNYLGGWLKNLYDHGKTRYAIVCLMTRGARGLALRALAPMRVSR